MGKIVLTDLDDAVLTAVRRRADAHGRTVEEELCSIVADAVRPEVAPPPEPPAGDRAAMVAEMKRHLEEMRAKYGTFPDSVPDIREWRDKW